MENPEVVNDFLQILAEKLRPHSEKDLGVMRSMKKADIGSSSVSNMHATVIFEASNLFDEQVDVIGLFYMQQIFSKIISL